MMQLWFYGEDCEDHDKVWYVGDTTPLTEEEINAVFEVRADYDELEYLRKMFQNLRFHTTKELVRWFDSDARFIAANL